MPPSLPVDLLVQIYCMLYCPLRDPNKSDKTFECYNGVLSNVITRTEGLGPLAITARNVCISGQFTRISYAITFTCATSNTLSLPLRSVRYAQQCSDYNSRLYSLSRVPHRPSYVSLHLAYQKRIAECDTRLLLKYFIYTKQKQFWYRPIYLKLVRDTYFRKCYKVKFVFGKRND